ncbi:MAG: DNA polymerase III subunit beta [Clostridiales bacterium]|nr:DNA polymerase III subunit beta [Clostridiales bacterium]
MKLICDGLDLSDAVLKVSKALSVKSTNPVLEGIKIIAKCDSLTLIATDMELTISKKIKADVLMEGETVVVGKYFVEFVKKLEKEQIELCRLGEGGLEIKYSDSESELQVFPVENYPKIENDGNGDYFEIKQSELKKIIERTVFACSSDDSRPILKGCLFEVTDGVLTAVALDGFRMSVVKKEVKASGNFKVIIPSRTLLEITRLLDKEDQDVKVVLQKNSLFIELESTSLVSRLIEGEFVKYNHILPTSFANVVTVNKQTLLGSIERASIVAKNDRFNIVKFDVKETVMTVSAKSEIGNVNENVNVNLTGKDIAIAFNGKYLVDFLKIIGEDFINLNLNTAIDPCILKPVGDEDFLYLVLPVRINA